VQRLTWVPGDGVRRRLVFGGAVVARCKNKPTFPFQNKMYDIFHFDKNPIVSVGLNFSGEVYADELAGRQQPPVERRSRRILQRSAAGAHGGERETVSRPSSVMLSERISFPGRL